jgi:hypothetical protein
MDFFLTLDKKISQAWQENFSRLKKIFLTLGAKTSHAWQNHPT